MHHPWRTHILTSVSSIGAVLREFALHVVDRDELEHDDPLQLVFQIKLPVRCWVRPIELIPLQSEF